MHQNETAPPLDSDPANPPILFRNLNLVQVRFKSILSISDAMPVADVVNFTTQCIPDYITITKLIPGQC